MPSKKTYAIPKTDVNFFDGTRKGFLDLMEYWIMDQKLKIMSES